MEDQVPFKVFAFWNGDSKAEVRRFGVEKLVVTSFHYVNAKLQDVYPGLKGKSYSVTWKDEDGDDITISSDEEMMTALTALHGNLIKLNVYIKSDGSKDDDCNIIFTTVTDHPPVLGACNSSHYGVMCDGCNTPVVGFRYKCTSCDDFDLCSKCEGAGLHPEHCMVRVPSPVMPRHLIKAAIKRSRHFLKTVSATDDNSYKRHRHDKSGGGERRHHHGDRKHDDPNRRQRTSWLDTFATYMNEFANLAGDIGVNLDQQKGCPKPQEQAKTTDASTSAEAPQATQQEPNATASGNPNAQCPLGDVENIPQLIQMYFNGTLASYMEQRAKEAQPPTTPSSTPAASENDVEMASATPNAEPKPQEADKVSIKSEASSSAESVRDASPEKVDGWTVINKEKDFIDNFDKPSAPAEPSAPIGFNLPLEFQQRVTIDAGQGLYPPLHAAAAVPASTPLAAPLPAPLTPQQAQSTSAQKPSPVAAAAAAAAAARAAAFGKPQPQQQPQRQPQPGPLHPKPHIDAAIKQMLAMGFTNEGGWLTMMLENVDGNIAAVMDLLTPVKPQ